MDPADDREQLELLRAHREQREHEGTGPSVPFGVPYPGAVPL